MNPVPIAASEHCPELADHQAVGGQLRFGRESGTNHSMTIRLQIIQAALVWAHPRPLQSYFALQVLGENLNWPSRLVSLGRNICSLSRP